MIFAQKYIIMAEWSFYKDVHILYGIFINSELVTSTSKFNTGKIQSKLINISSMLTLPYIQHTKIITFTVPATEIKENTQKNTNLKWQYAH